MALEFWVFSGLALVLGVKHAFDADHLVAVSGILTRSGNLTRSLALGASWASGHLVTATLVSAAIFFLADTVLAGFLSRMEFLVPVMLILIGVVGLLSAYRRLHVHRHAHVEGGPKHAHLHVHRHAHHEHGAMAGIGVVHGLASNDELLAVLLLGLGASSWWQMFAGVLFFSLGVLLGMVVYAAGVHVAGRSGDRRWVPGGVTVAVSVLSVGYGLWLLLGGAALNVLDAFSLR